MGDSFGGLVANIDHSGGSSNGLARFGGPAGVTPWRYESAGIINHQDHRVAQAPDGAIYAVEQLHAGYDKDGWPLWDKHALVIDGATGQVMQRTPLPPEVRSFHPTNTACASTHEARHPETVGPVVGDDGRGYLLVRRRIRHAYASCSETTLAARDQQVGIDLYVLSPTAPPVLRSVYDEHCVSGVNQRSVCDVGPMSFQWNPQVVPDGLGGLLVSWVRTTSVVGGSYYGTKFVSRFEGTDPPATQAVTWDTSITMTGEAGTAFVYSDGARHAMDVTTWQPQWTFPVNLPPALAISGGGVAVHDASNGVLIELSPAGAASDPTSMPLEWPRQSRLGMLTGMSTDVNSRTLARIVSPALDEAMRSFAAFAGSPTWQAAPYVACEPNIPFWHAKPPAGPIVTFMFDLSTNWTATRISAVMLAIDMWNKANEKQGIPIKFDQMYAGTADLLLRNVPELKCARQDAPLRSYASGRRASVACR